MLRFILYLVFLAAAPWSIGAAPEIQTGQYVRDRDSGTLTKRTTGDNRRTFKIESVGSNCHSCSVSGSIRGTTGHADSWAEDGSESGCTISFSGDRSALAVRPISEDACRAYCGMRAGFDGTYHVPPASCPTAGKQAVRDRFLRLYRARRYSQATETLQGLVAQCGNFMNWIETDQVRNDLALAQYHNGEFRQCLATLSASIAAGVKDEEELRAGSRDLYLPPCDFDNYIDVAKATWYNKALCARAATRGR